MGIVKPTVQECFIPQEYTSSPEVIKNCLQEVLNDTILVSPTSVPDDETMRRERRERLIREHDEKYKIKYYESDNRWHSFLPDETRKRGTKPIARRNREDLEKDIIAYYEEQDKLLKRKAITLRTLYPEWFAYKWQDTNNSKYMKHIDGEWKRFYLKDEIIDRPITELTTLELKNWARAKIVAWPHDEKAILQYVSDYSAMS